MFLFNFEDLEPQKIVKKRGPRFSKFNKKWSLEHILKVSGSLLKNVGEDIFLDSIFRACD